MNKLHKTLMDRKMSKVLHEWKAGTLHSGSSKGPKVTSRAQAIAIGLSEGRRAAKARSSSGHK